MSSLIAYFGGSFDPVHLGHLATANELVETLALQRLWFLPAALSPLKNESLPGHHRVAMLQLAIQAYPQLAVDSRELDRPPPSYTVDTLKTLRAEHGDQQPLAFIMGMDSFLSLPHWHDWRQLTDFAHLIVVTRPSYQPDFGPELQEWTNNHRCNDRQLLECQVNGLIYFVATRPHAISSSAIRAGLASGKTPNPMLPPAVTDYIYSHHLYGVTATNES
jgi:nicotinate-nucleotide adenylyltransferase